MGQSCSSSGRVKAVNIHRNISLTASYTHTLVTIFIFFSTPAHSWSGNKVKQMAAAAAVSHRAHKEDQLHRHSANKAANVRKQRQQRDKHLDRRQQLVDTVAEQLTCCHLSSQIFTMILATANQRVIAWLH